MISEQPAPYDRETIERFIRETLPLVAGADSPQGPGGAGPLSEAAMIGAGRPLACAPLACAPLGPGRMPLPRRAVIGTVRPSSRPDPAACRRQVVHVLHK